MISRNISQPLPVPTIPAHQYCVLPFPIFNLQSLEIQLSKNPGTFELLIRELKVHKKIQWRQFKMSLSLKGRYNVSRLVRILVDLLFYILHQDRKMAPHTPNGKVQIRSKCSTTSSHLNEEGIWLKLCREYVNWLQL